MQDILITHKQARRRFISPNQRQQQARTIGMTKDHKDNNDHPECVGSLIVHASDLHELEGEHLNQHKGSPGGQEVTLQKRKTAVGTLMVPQSDLETHADAPKDGKEPVMVRIRRRITEELAKPTSQGDELPDLWWA